MKSATYRAQQGEDDRAATPHKLSTFLTTFLAIHLTSSHFSSTNNQLTSNPTHTNHEHL